MTYLLIAISLIVGTFALVMGILSMFITHHWPIGIINIGLGLFNYYNAYRGWDRLREKRARAGDRNNNRRGW